jgi:SAM-dependent methyltransferase
MAVDPEHLLALYVETDDPWNFRTSAYEAAKFDATLAALPGRHFRHVLELGCGNGELGRRLAARADAYTGLDAVPRALAAGREAVPGGRFVQAFLPCPLPEPHGPPYDLIVLSEILYFLDGDGLRALAGFIDRDAPHAQVLAVTWTGPSGNTLQGPEAVAAFSGATGRPSVRVRETERFRIDRYAHLAGA